MIMKLYGIECSGWMRSGTLALIPEPEGINFWDYFADSTPVSANNRSLAKSVWLARYKGPDGDGVQPVWDVVEVAGV